MSVKRVGFVVRGRVQGVGFRASARSAARQRGVTGSVRNRSDGAVDGEAQGAAAAVDGFVAWLRGGPPWARVDAVDLEELPVVDGETDFVVVR